MRQMKEVGYLRGIAFNESLLAKRECEKVDETIRVHKSRAGEVNTSLRQCKLQNE